MLEPTTELEKQLHEENSTLTQKVKEQAQLIKILEGKIDALARKVFGKSSEQLNPDQLQLLLDGIEGKKPNDDGQEDLEAELSSKPTPAKPRKKRTSREATLPKNIETEETIILPDEVQNDPQNYRQIDEEVTTKLDFEPAKFKKLVTRRPKFVKRLTTIDDPEADQFYIAPLPKSLKERSLLTPRLAAEIATNRYCDHQPYYRQEQHFFMRHGVHLPRNTMSQWIGDLSKDYLTGIYQALHQEMVAENYLQVDETPIDYLQPGHGSTKKGYLWTLSRPDLKATDGRGDIFYHWNPSRSAKVLPELLSTDKQTFQGVLQCDGYQAYETYQKQTEGISLLGCWAHVRRKFYEAKDYKPKLTGWILNQIQNLYAIEAQLRQHQTSARERERIRHWQSIPIYQRLGKALKRIKTHRKVLPKSPLGKAIDYALGQWSKLERCFQDGRLEIDNNLIENGIRPTKLGAKNWLFMGSEAAGQTNAIWFTLIESCRRRKIDPWSYLVWLFEELPTIKVKKNTFNQYTPKAYANKLSKKQKLKQAS